MGTRRERRIEFLTGSGCFGGGRQRGTTQPAGCTIAHWYKIEVSSDGKVYSTVLDKTGNNVTKYVEFDELPPTACRFVRLTMTDWPRRGTSPLGIMEFTVFGKAIEPGKK